MEACDRNVTVSVRPGDDFMVKRCIAGINAGKRNWFSVLRRRYFKGRCIAKTLLTVAYWS